MRLKRLGSLAEAGGEGVNGISVLSNGKDQQRMDWRIHNYNSPMHGPQLVLLSYYYYIHTYSCVHSFGVCMYEPEDRGNLIGSSTVPSHNSVKQNPRCKSLLSVLRYG